MPQPQKNPYKSAEEIFADLGVVTTMTARIEERIKAIIEKQHQQNERIKEAEDTFQDTYNRLVVLESRGPLGPEIQRLQAILDQMSQDLLMIKLQTKQDENKWGNIIDFAFKIALTVMSAIILFKLGLKAP